MSEKEMDLEGILFCRCGMVDKTLPGKTAEQRFINSTVGLKHSQTSWYTLTALDAMGLHLKSYRLFLPVSVFFLTQTCSEK